VGLSSRARNNDYGIERFAADLHAVISWTGASDVVLVGHSIGGMILQTFSRLFPAEPSVAGIALVHTTYKNPMRTTKFGAFYTAIEKPVILPLLYLTIAISPLVWVMNLLSYLNGSTHRSTDKQSFSGGETRGQLDFVSRFVLVQSPGVLARGMLGMMKFDESAHLKNINYRTLVVPAENDPVTLPMASAVLTESIPYANSALIQRGKHQAQMEMHGSFLETLEAFVRRSLASHSEKNQGVRSPHIAATKAFKNGLRPET
jgi:pimeloyl-ACP methyl ester carboxylesterase